MPSVRQCSRFLFASALGAALTIGSAAPAFASHPDRAEIEELEQRRDRLEEGLRVLRGQQAEVDRAIEDLVSGHGFVGSGHTTGTAADALAADRRLLRWYAESDRIERELSAAVRQQTRVGSRLQEAEASDVRRSAKDVELFHPTPGYDFGSPFGQRLHPISRTMRLHAGVDIGAPAGTPVLAAADGTVAHAGWMGGYGMTVDIAHPNGLMTRYAHLSEIRVTTGQVIAHQEPLGNVGSSGQSTGPHLHFEVHRDGTPIDPATFYRD